MVKVKTKLRKTHLACLDGSSQTLFPCFLILLALLEEGLGDLDVLYISRKQGQSTSPYFQACIGYTQSRLVRCEGEW